MNTTNTGTIDYSKMQRDARSDGRTDKACGWPMWADRRFAQLLGAGRALSCERDIYVAAYRSAYCQA